MNKVSSLIPRTTYIVNVILLGIFLVISLRVIVSMLVDGLYPLATALSGIVVFLTLVFLRRHFTPLRWIAIGISLALLFTLYPLLYTLYLSVTNMGSGHLMTKQQAISRLESQFYLPEDGLSYRWSAFQAEDGSYALWLMPAEGDGFLALPGESPNVTDVGELDEDGIPVAVAGYERLPMNRVVPLITELSSIDFGEVPNTVRIRSLREAAALQPKYQYDAAQDAMIDQETGAVYRPVEGTFTAETGETLAIGYIEYIGLRHFSGFLNNAGFREPLLRMLMWNILFAFGSVFFSFGLGLAVTLLFEDLPGRRIIRALLIIPWPIPVLISILIWRSMLNPDLGFVAPVLESIFGASPSWFQDPVWTRIAVIMVNVWLSYPYFYVITAGAIRSIPKEIYDAAVVDGAGGWSKLSNITLPLVLRIVMPLLIASFTFNFNNFNVIYLFNYGNPPMANTIVPMGHTDILISFVYRLAFVTSNVTNYGLAAAITVMLFILVATMVLIQMRFTRMFQEVES